MELQGTAWHPDMGVPIDAKLSGVPAFEPAGYRTSSSGRTQLLQPNLAMREVHRRLRRVIGRPWQSGPEIMARVAQRLNYRFFYILDLEDAFGNVPRVWLADFLLEHCEHVLPQDEIETFISSYLMRPQGGLVQGAPMSPILFEFFATRELDIPLRTHILSAGTRFGYQRYVDDLVFMSHHPMPLAERRAIKAHIRRIGMVINEKKARGVVLRKNTLTLTGVSIRRTRSGVRMFIPRKKLARLEGLLHYANQGRLVDMRQIEGLMSVFLQVTNPKHMNATELRVVRAYEKLTEAKVHGWHYRPPFPRVPAVTLPQMQEPQEDFSDISGPDGIGF